MTTRIISIFSIMILLLSFVAGQAQVKSQVYDFKRGDILIKPNHNWLPGTTFFEGGRGFGHAAIVLEDARDTNLVELLKKTTIFESHARDVAVPDQIRKIPAFKEGDSPGESNLYFSEYYKGNRYRLRPNLTSIQIDSIIGFITAHDEDISSWRSVKKYNAQTDFSERHWYCTLIIWQAYFDILKVDLDANQGLIVFPNDILNSPFFSKPENISRF
jgi:hypothetical protein